MLRIKSRRAFLSSGSQIILRAAVELMWLRLVLNTAAGCPASGDVSGARGYVAGQLGLVCLALMSPFLMCVSQVTTFRMNLVDSNSFLSLRSPAVQPALPFAGSQRW